MLFASGIVLIDKIRDGVNNKLGVWRQSLKSKWFKLSRIKIKYLEYKFIIVMDKTNMEVRLDTQAIPKR